MSNKSKGVKNEVVDNFDDFESTFIDQDNDATDGDKNQVDEQDDFDEIGWVNDISAKNINSLVPNQKEISGGTQVESDKKVYAWTEGETLTVKFVRRGEISASSQYSRIEGEKIPALFFKKKDGRDAVMAEAVLVEQKGFIEGEIYHIKYIGLKDGKNLKLFHVYMEKNGALIDIMPKIGFAKDETVFQGTVRRIISMEIEGRSFSAVQCVTVEKVELMGKEVPVVVIRNFSQSMIVSEYEQGTFSDGSKVVFKKKGTKRSKSGREVDLVDILVAK